MSETSGASRHYDTSIPFPVQIHGPVGDFVSSVIYQIHIMMNGIAFCHHYHWPLWKQGEEGYLVPLLHR